MHIWEVAPFGGVRDRALESRLSSVIERRTPLSWPSLWLATASLCFQTLLQYCANLFSLALYKGLLVCSLLFISSTLILVHAS
jgi:hypothetical protein